MAADHDAGVQRPRRRDADQPDDGDSVRQLDGDRLERTSTSMRRTDQITRRHCRDNKTVSQHFRVILTEVIAVMTSVGIDLELEGGG